MEAIAAELLAQGHRLTIVQQADAAATLRHPQLGFAQAGAASHPPGLLKEVVDAVMPASPHSSGP